MFVSRKRLSQWIPRLSANLSYANWRVGKQQGEVDIVGINKGKLKPEWAVEIKWSDKFFDKPEELTSLSYFMEKNKLNYALVTSKTQSGTRKIAQGVLQFMPVACYAYLVGENTLKRTRENFGL